MIKKLISKNQIEKIIQLEAQKAPSPISYIEQNSSLMDQWLLKAFEISDRSSNFKHLARLRNVEAASSLCIQHFTFWSSEDAISTLHLISDKLARQNDRNNNMQETLEKLKFIIQDVEICTQISKIDSRYPKWQTVLELSKNDPGLIINRLTSMSCFELSKSASLHWNQSALMEKIQESQVLDLFTKEFNLSKKFAYAEAIASISENYNAICSLLDQLKNSPNSQLFIVQHLLNTSSGLTLSQRSKLEKQALSYQVNFVEFLFKNISFPNDS